MIVELEKINFKNDIGIWVDRYINLKNITHYHSEVELIFIKEGSLKINVNTNRYICNQGDIVICNSDDVHYIESIENSICDIIIFDVNIIKSISDFFIIECHHIPKNNLLENNLDPKSLINRVNFEINRQDKFYKELAYSTILNFFSHLYRIFATNYTKADKNNPNIITLYKKLITYIEHHYDTITFEEAANITHYSRAYFSRIFKNIAGMTFSSYVNLVRIEKAIEKIKTKESNITQIAIECGFDSIRHFNRVFKEVTGITPKKVTKDFNFINNPTKI